MASLGRSSPSYRGQSEDSDLPGAAARSQRVSQLRNYGGKRHNAIFDELKLPSVTCDHPTLLTRSAEL